MADHMRTRIRHGAVQALTGLALTGSNVFPSSIYAMRESRLPGLRVYTQDETTEGATLGMADRIVERTLQLVVECCVKHVDDYDDKLDEVIRQVEVALAGQQSLGVGVKYIGPPDTEIVFDAETDKPVAIGRLTFSCFYVTTQNAPDVAL